MTMKILVIGGTGQLGRAMVRRLASTHEVTSPTSSETDVTKAEDVRAAMTSARPDVVINCSAYNKVDAAEDEPVVALAVNAWGPKLFARAAAEAGATIVHFSTDFVFDGVTSRPYVETDTPRPQSAYAISKFIGELLVREAPRHYVLRVESLFGSPTARGSVDMLLDAIVTGREARAFSDRVVSPSYIDDVAAATESLLERQAPFGLYHCVNTGFTTWLDLAHEIARLTGRADARIVPVPVAEATLRARRPKFAALSNAKLHAAGIEMPTWQDALRRHVQRDRT